MQKINKKYKRTNKNTKELIKILKKNKLIYNQREIQKNKK
jgi:hypothetical protein